MCIRDRSKANRLHCSTADKAPQRTSLPSSLSAKLVRRSRAKDAASTSKGTPKLLSREARAKALFCANPLCGDKRIRTSSYARSERASALDRLGPTGSDLRKFLTNKRKSESFSNYFPLLSTSGMSAGDTPLGPLPAGTNPRHFSRPTISF